MRISTLAKRLIDVSGITVSSVEVVDDGVVFDVRPRHGRARCGSCGEKASRYDRRQPRRWRHLTAGRCVLWLRYAPRRVSCRRCGVCSEKVPWGEAISRFSFALEETVAYLAQITDKTTVTKLVGIAWRTVGRIVERVVMSRLDPSRLDGLRFIGIDEFSYRRRHHYLTVIVDHIGGRVVWAAPGRSAETLEGFFAELGSARAAELEVVTLDMAAGYLKVLRERAPQAQIVFDRFHVQRLVSDALDKLRRLQMRELEDIDARRAIKRTRFALLKNPWNLRDAEKAKLSEVERTNKPLYRGYLLKEALARALDYQQPKRALEALENWLSWASRSRLDPFVRAARTIRQHKQGILAYVAYRLTNGVVEGINNRLRMIARRAFGFHTAPPLIAMLFLCCGGITLNPPLPSPT